MALEIADGLKILYVRVWNPSTVPMLKYNKITETVAFAQILLIYVLLHKEFRDYRYEVTLSVCAVQFEGDFVN